MMFKKICILAALLLASSGYCQVLSVEQYSSYIINEQSIPDNTTELRDLSGIFNNYLGHWRYTYGNKQIDFYITKETYDIQSITKDAITIRYEIRENGQIILDNTNLSTNNDHIIKGSNYIVNVFFNAYLFINDTCFKEGELYFKYNQIMDLATGVIMEELDVYPSYFWYVSNRANCSTYQAPFPDYFIMNRM